MTTADLASGAGLARGAGLALGAVLLFGPAAPAAPAQPIALSFRASGAVSDKVSLTSTADDAHLCALIGSSGGPGTYLFLFNKTPADAMLDPRRPGLFVTVAGVRAASWQQGDRSEGTIQVSIGGRRFLGLGPADPSFRLHVSFRPGGAGGRFEATHLVDPSGTAAIDVEGSWRCPLGATGAPARASPPVRPTSLAQSTSPLALGVRVVSPPTPTPAIARGIVTAPSSTAAPAGVPPPPADIGPAEPSGPAAEAWRTGHFRLFRNRARCRGPCLWVAVDLDSGRHFDATADFAPMDLAPRLAAEARSGRIELTITGELRAPASSHFALIRVQRLDGVAPHAVGHIRKPRFRSEPKD